MGLQACSGGQAHGGAGLDAGGTGGGAGAGAVDGGSAGETAGQAGVDALDSGAGGQDGGMAGEGGTAGAVAVCPPGRGDCNKDGRCETDLYRSLGSCGECGASCQHPNAQTSACVGGVCTLTGCPRGRFNCDGDSANGCEAASICPGIGGLDGCPPGQAICGHRQGACAFDLLTSNYACGRCGGLCLEQGTACISGVCTVVWCPPGHFNCDGNAANGCETAGPCDGSGAGAGGASGQGGSGGASGTVGHAGTVGQAGVIGQAGVVGQAGTVGQGGGGSGGGDAGGGGLGGSSGTMALAGSDSMGGAGGGLGGFGGSMGGVRGGAGVGGGTAPPVLEPCPPPSVCVSFPGSLQRVCAVPPESAPPACNTAECTQIGGTCSTRFGVPVCYRACN